MQTSYYRIARQTPNSGVKTRGRKSKTATAPAARGPRRSKASQGDQLNELARELEERARKLRAIAVSIDGLETDAAKLRQISDLLS